MEQDKREWLFGKTFSQIENIVLELGAKKFVAKQICDWLYKKQVNDIEEMTNLSKDFRVILSQKYQVGYDNFHKVDTSVDGTRKYLFKACEGCYIESAYIPDRERATLCVSCQGGCRMGCKFCMTGRQKLQHSLSSGEILNQVKSIEESNKLSNIVFMGMGEPMDNAEEVFRTIEILTASWGYAWSPTRITLSTIGVLPMVKKYIAEHKSHLTISLHSAIPDVRKQIMPVENKYSIVDIVAELRKHDFSHQRRLTFSYTMFSGVNDSNSDADKICELLHGMDCRINLIPFHQIPDSDLRPTSHDRIVKFRDYLTRKGFITTIRASRGEDIFAACGLLSTTEKEKNV